MAVLQNRSRLVTFRLSDQEYEQVRNTCREEGVRSLSEFARRAVLHQVALHGASSVNFGDDLSALSLRLVELDQALEELRDRISQLVGRR